MINQLFFDELQRVLLNLYNPAILAKSPLLRLFDVSKRANATIALQDILLNEIHRLKPPPGSPPNTDSWRVYQVLTYRFAEKRIQKNVAADMALSIRHLRRLENTAILMLEEVLWKRYAITNEKIGEAFHEKVFPAKGEESILQQLVEAPSSSQQELEWLKQSSNNTPVNLQELIESVLTTIAPLTEMLQARITRKIPDTLPSVNGQASGLRQAIINIITCGLIQTNGAEVQISGSQKARNVLLTITVRQKQGLTSGNCESEQPLKIAQKLIELSGGSLEIDGRNGFTARLSFHTINETPVLVIDDNHDTLQLYKRYLSNSRFRFIGLSNARQVFEITEQEKPAIIILDVMMPDIDGWELMGRIREHPSTRHIPVIIYTIMPQEMLARSLGAADFILKPVDRNAFLAALDRQRILLEQGSH